MVIGVVAAALAVLGAGLGLWADRVEATVLYTIAYFIVLAGVVLGFGVILSYWWAMARAVLPPRGRQGEE
jgi:hypothetical protein